MVDVQHSTLHTGDTEAAQDAVGGILTDSASVDFTYNDAGPTITAVVKPLGVAIDSLGAATDTADLNASTTAHGLLKKLSNVVTEFLNGQGSFSVPDHASLDNLTTGDPHTQYRLEAADHTHATTGLQAGKLAQANTHESPDTDVATSSLHHTIGVTATTAAAGDHAHTGNAPDDVNYLVGSASAGLSNEIAVGTTPNGELGGTWSAITVDASHGGGTHAATQAAAESTAASAAATHAAAVDPHTGYRLESADHSHASTGLQAGKLAQANTHESPDTDSATSSLHHTVGSSATQAAAGNHTHTGNAPDSVDYLVGTASGGLSGEIAVGTTPGGELGGTWAAPTVDIVHAGATAWADYTPTWGASVTPPTLGSTTIAGRFKKLDTNTVIVTINIVITTGGAWAAGSGDYTFSIPAGMTGAARHQIGSLHVRDLGSVYYAGVCSVRSGATVITGYSGDAGGTRALSNGQPIASLATGDEINLSILFEI